MNRARLGRYLVGTVAFAAGISLAAQAQFAAERPIRTVGPGPHRVEVDIELMSRGAPFTVVPRGGRPVAENGLADLRLFDDAGGAIPYLLVYAPSREPSWVSARATLALAPTDTSSGFEVDLGAVTEVDRVRIDGLASPFLKRLVLEGSGDRVRWTMLAAEGTVFDLPDEQLNQTEVAFTPGAFQYLRVTWDDTNSGRVGLPRSVAARRTPPAADPPSATAAVPVERRASEPGVSRHLIRLPSAGLPVVALELDVAGGHVFRQAVVMESQLSGAQAVPVEIGRTTLRRVVQGGAAASALRVAIEPPSQAELELVIEDGANPPLELTGVSVVLAELPWIYFEAPAGPVVARYGSRGLAQPLYDLEAARAGLRLESLPEAGWEPSRATTSGPGAEDLTEPGTGAPLEASSFRYVRDVSGSPGLAAVTLDAAVLAHSQGPSGRFSDVRLLDLDNRQIPYVLEQRDEPQVVEVPIRAAGEPRAVELRGSAGRSLYRAELPFSGLPESRLVLDTPARVFRRSVRVGVEREPDRRHRDVWFDVARSAEWRHTDPQTPATSLALSLRALNTDALIVEVDEGDNAPLPIAGARLLLPSYRLRFYLPESGARLAYGRSDLGAPQYDLALLAPRVMGTAAADATIAPESAEPAGGAAPLVSPVLFWTLLGVAVTGLTLLIVRLVRSGAAG